MLKKLPLDLLKILELKDELLSFYDFSFQSMLTD